jgi:hypothetical protein
MRRIRATGKKTCIIKEKLKKLRALKRKIWASDEKLNENGNIDHFKRNTS